MEPEHDGQRGQRGARPRVYRIIRIRDRGNAVAIPARTYYDRLRRARRNANGVPQDVNVGRNNNNNMVNDAENIQPPELVEDQNLEDNDRNEGDGVVPDVGGEGRNVDEDNAPFLEALLPGAHDDNLGEGDLAHNRGNIEVDNSLEEPLTPDLQRTKFETLLLVLNFSIRHGLTGVATEDLLSMINVITGSDLLTSRHLFKKVFAGDMELKRHMYCPDCMVYIGEITPELKRLGVGECGNRRCPRRQVKVPGTQGTDFFVTLPIGSQIVDMLQNMDDVMNELNHRWRRDPSNNIRDLFDGKIYKDLMKEGNFLHRQYNLSLTFSTDGAAVFNSGCTTMWPIFFRLNEFQPKVRFSGCNTMLAGLWFGKKKPQMAMYFNNFLGECRNLYEQGINWRSPDGQVINSKVITLNCVLDSGAKYMLQGTKQYNGLQGCPYCDHPGEILQGSNVAKWPMNEQRATLDDLGFAYSIRKFDRATLNFVTCDVFDRSNDEMRRDMEVAEERRRVQPAFDGYRGLKFKSPLYYLPFFDICLGFQIDYMHATLLGNCKYLAGLWFDSPNNQEPYYLKLRMGEINERLSTIFPPSNLSRRPRKIDDYKDWHANEWRSWLLYYSLPCLKNILPPRHYKHHCILVTSIHTLLGDNIARETLDAVAEHLADYVAEFEDLYGAQNMVWNVHLLLHLPKTVLHWGPLWCYSMFSFESGNNNLMKLVKGSTAVAMQITSKYAMSKFLPHIVKEYEVSDEVQNYCTELISYSRNIHSLAVGGVTLLNLSFARPLTAEERQAFHANNVRVSDEVYGHMMKDSVKYQCKAYNYTRHIEQPKETKTDDSTVRLIDGTYATIYRILPPVDDRVLLLLRKINTGGFITMHDRTRVRAQHIKVCSRNNLYGAFFFRDAREVAAKSILMNCPPNNYIAEFPNLLEKD